MRDPVSPPRLRNVNQSNVFIIMHAGQYGDTNNRTEQVKGAEQWLVIQPDRLASLLVLAFIKWDVPGGRVNLTRLKNSERFEKQA